MTELSDMQIIPWGIKAINLPGVWSDVTGNGIKIAILDSGIDFYHSDFGENIHKGVNFVNPKIEPYDDNGHGTLVSGIIGAQNNDVGIVGVSPGAEIYPIKVLDKNGNGDIAHIASAIDWCIQHDIKIINMSFSIKRDSPILKNSVDRATESGIIVVASAKNSFGGEVGYPASYENVISVTSVDSRFNIGKNASRGKIDFSAPGVDIITTSKNGTYEINSGNSLAAPFITGIIALVLEKPYRFGMEKKEKYIITDIKKALANLSEGLGEESFYGKGFVVIHFER